MATRV
jgi:hypothetical protein